MFRDDFVFVLDFDGILTDGKMYYTKEGKQMKSFGSDDWDLLKEFSKCIKINIISADKKGFAITKKRVEEEMNLQLDFVNGSSIERWEWVKNKYPHEKIIYMGDSLNDFYSIKNAHIGITVNDALKTVKDVANIVTERTGGMRAVAEAILIINEIHGFFNLFDMLNKREQT